MAGLDWGSALLASASLVVGSGLTVAADALRHRSARRDAREDAHRAEQAEKRRRIEERSEKAAIAIVGLLDEAFAQYEGSYEHGSGPKDQAKLDSIIERLERESVYLTDDRVREQVEIAAEAFERIYILEQWGEGGRPRGIAWKIRKAARQVIGSVIRGTPGPKDDDLPKLRATIQDYYEQQE